MSFFQNHLIKIMGKANNKTVNLAQAKSDCNQGYQDYCVDKLKLLNKLKQYCFG